MSGLVVSISGPVTTRTLITGILWAVVAGLMWGLAFVAPLLLPGYHPVELTAGRYAAYGLVSVGALLAAQFSGPVVGLRDPRIWWTALLLTLIGNLLYFALLAAGIPATGAPMAALIIGTLPVLLPIAAGYGNAAVALGRFIAPGILILLGLAAVHVGEPSVGAVIHAGSVATSYWIGIALVVGALLSWTIYGVANARAIAARPDITASTWASLQGVTLLPVALPLLGFSVLTGATHGSRPDLGMFIAVSLALGILTSWVAMWCWNKAAQLLPAHIAGQLIVFETLAGLLYAYLWKMQFPPALVVLGAVLLIAGVLLGVARLRRI